MGCEEIPPVTLTATSDFPELCVEWLPTHGPGAADGEWCDITAYVAEGSTSRGRQYELDRFQAGTCTLTLKADTRLFDPENTASGFYGLLVPMRQLRVSAVWASTRYPIFRGYITDWGQTQPDDAMFVTTINASDAFMRLEQIKLPSSAWALEVLQDDPSLWFRLGETDTARVTDSSDGGYYGLYDNVTQGAEGLVPNDADGAVIPEDPDSRVWIQAPTLISGYPFTVSGLFKIDNSDPTKHNAVFAGVHDPTDFDPTFRIYVASTADLGATGIGQLVAVIRSGGLFQGKVTSVPVNDDIAHHFMFVASSSSSTALYLDGVAHTGGYTDTVAWPGNPENGYTIGNYIDTAFGDYNFDGTIDEIAVWDGVALSATDAAAHSLAAKSGWDGDDTGARVDRFLDAIGWPDTLRDLDTGISILGPANWSAGSSALSVMQGWADTEYGLFLIDTEGKVVWRSRHSPYLDSFSTTSQATYGDAHSAATLKYTDVDLPRDEALIRNPVQAGRAGGVTVTAEDATYVEKYGDRTFAAPTTEDQLDSAVRDRAVWLVERYKELGTRLRSMSFAPRSDTDLWPQVLGREIGERITVKRTPLGLNSEISSTQIIEGVDHQFSPKDWTTRFRGSPVDPNVGSYLILDDATYGKLDVAALAY